MAKQIHHCLSASPRGGGGRLSTLEYKWINLVFLNQTASIYYCKHIPFNLPQCFFYDKALVVFDIIHSTIPLRHETRRAKLINVDKNQFGGTLSQIIQF